MKIVHNNISSLFKAPLNWNKPTHINETYVLDQDDHLNEQFENEDFGKRKNTTYKMRENVLINVNIDRFE